MPLIASFADVTTAVRSTGLVTANQGQPATVKFNYPTTTLKVQIQTSEEAMQKFTESLKETNGWNVGLKVGGEVLSELEAKIPEIGGAKKGWKFVPELSGGVSGSTETGSSSESGSTVAPPNVSNFTNRLTGDRTIPASGAGDRTTIFGPRVTPRMSSCRAPAASGSAASCSVMKTKARASVAKKMTAVTKTADAILRTSWRVVHDKAKPTFKGVSDE